MEKALILELVDYCVVDGQLDKERLRKSVEFMEWWRGKNE
jgi:hypothetical protein